MDLLKIGAVFLASYVKEKTSQPKGRLAVILSPWLSDIVLTHSDIFATELQKRKVTNTNRRG